MRIAQLTDLHIGLADQDTNGVDVRAQFLRTLAAAVATQPDYLVVSGDLCYHVGDELIYGWIKNQLDQTQIPYYLIAGNHDDNALMIRCFGLQDLAPHGQLYYQTQLQQHPVLFLDTASYEMDPEQLQWLTQQLSSGPPIDRILFIHHPPALAGVPFMDEKYPLRNWHQVLATLSAYAGRLHVFCGHYHVDKTIGIANVQVYISPSTFFQIDDSINDFGVAHHKPGFRVIDWDGQTLVQGVRYV